MKRHLFLIITLLLLAGTTHADNKKFTLVIDAGALGKFSKEKNINLNVALAFGRYVEQNCPDVRVVYTRKTDVFIPLHTRADIANKNKADVFISIHTNSVESRQPVRGMETYTMGMRRSDEKLSAAKRENDVILIEKDYQQHYAGYDPHSPESIIMFEFINDKNMQESVELARLIQRHTCKHTGRPDKGVKQDVFLVLRETSMPACLVELGYISTPDEEQFLNKQTSVDAMGRGIYEAFVAYKKKRTGDITVPFQAKQKQSVNLPQIVPQEESKAPQPESNSSKDEAEETKPESAPQQEQASNTADETQPTPPPAAQDTDNPIFKVQILASAAKLKPANPQLKGHKEADYYQEAGLYKYTIGASANYNEIYQLRKTLLQDFPQAFIIAFKDNEKMNTAEAIRLFKANKAKKQ